MRTCSSCKETLDDSSFHARNQPNCRPSRVSRCKSCSKSIRKGYAELRSASRKGMRLNNIQVEKWIVQDSRGLDRKKGMKNDLTEKFVAETIARGCSYCGEVNLRMTLDRIDNELGHIQRNVVPACIRCNYMRGNMPHVAWLILCPAVRKARECGAFGKWLGRAKMVRIA